MNHSGFSYACAAAALLGSAKAFERAARSDFDYLLLSLYGNAVPAEQELQRRRQESRSNTTTYRKTLQRKTAYSLLWVLAAAAMAHWLVVAPSLPAATHPATQQLYAATSVVAFSWGTLGRLGWNQGSYGGVTVFEELDTIIFWLLYGLGTFFGVAAVASAA